MLDGHFRALVAHKTKTQACIGLHGWGKAELVACTSKAKDFPWRGFAESRCKAEHFGSRR